MGKKLTGYTEKTMQNRVTGAGAYFKDFDVSTDTFSSAVEKGKLLGATKGGGSFTAKPSIRTIEVDGVQGKAKGMEEIDSWEITLTANILEVTSETLALALGTSEIKDVTGKNYKQILGKSTIEMNDYIDNITFLGTVSGFNEPIIIQVYNVLSTDGLSITAKDKDDMVLALKFEAHYTDAMTDEPPFAIFVPVKQANSLSIKKGE